MTTEQLNYKLESDISFQRYHQAVSAYKQYLVGRCHNPIKLLVKSKYTGQLEEIEVPCGKCIHCRESYTNSWVFRLYAHAENYKYIYYTTLSYAPIYQQSKLSDFIVNTKLSENYWYYDTFNTNDKPAFHPSVLCKSHYQLFLKRLRNYLPDANISYVVSGEYGKTFGRPHYHFILFSDVPISQDIVENAWSLHIGVNSHGEYVSLRNHAQQVHYLIGNVQHVDLKATGNFDEIKTQGNKFSASYCFKYVCKYICKREYNDTRVKQLYKSLYPDIYDEDQNLHFAKLAAADNVVPDITHFYPNPYNSKPYEKVTSYNLFKTEYAPFFECSRGQAIGKVFLFNHLSEYQEGNFVKPTFFCSAMPITPKYFLRKVEQSIFCLEIPSPSPTKNISYKSVNYSDLRKVLLSEDFSMFFKPLYNHVVQDAKLFDSKVNGKDNLNFFDKFTNVHYMVYAYHGELVVASYLYSRKKRSYDLIDTETISNFCTRQLARLDISLHRYAIKKALLDDENKQRSRTNELLTGIDFSQVFNYETDSNFFDLRTHLCQQLTEEWHQHIINYNYKYKNYVF